MYITIMHSIYIFPSNYYSVDYTYDICDRVNKVEADLARKHFGCTFSESVLNAFYNFKMF